MSSEWWNEFLEDVGSVAKVVGDSAEAIKTADLSKISASGTTAGPAPGPAAPKTAQVEAPSPAQAPATNNMVLIGVAVLAGVLLLTR